MGRHKLPSNVKKLKNTYREYRENQEEPIPESLIGDAPDCLNIEQKKAWVELLENVPDGVLTGADRIIVEIASRLLSELRIKDRLSVGKMSHLISCLARMGLTPSDRSKISINKPKRKRDPWEKFG